jgi:hypothetical protein
MKTITSLVLVAIVLAGIGWASLGAARFEREMADAQQYASTERYEEARTSLAAADRYLAYGRWVPQVGAAADHDLQARRAALDYWQRNYAAVLPRDSDPVGGVEASNQELQAIVANAAYRAGQADAHDKNTTIQAYDEAIGGFQTLLKNDVWNEDAAFNYEYLVRARDEFARGRRKGGSAKPDGAGQLGNSGSPAQSGDTKKFEIYVPLNGNERTKSGEAGKGTGNARKG